MTIEDKKIPYELLVRYGTDGKPVGAHVQYRRVVIMDGETLKEELGVAEPIDLEGFPTSAIMDDTTRDALAHVTALNAKVHALTKQNSKLTLMVEKLVAEKLPAEKPVK
jgi:hypothetical protein